MNSHGKCKNPEQKRAGKAGVGCAGNTAIIRLKQERVMAVNGLGGPVGDDGDTENQRFVQQPVPQWNFSGLTVV